MYKNKLILSSLLAFFCFLMVIGSVTATDNSTLGDDLAIAENYSSQNQLNSIEETDTLNSDFNENSLEKCSFNQKQIYSFIRNFVKSHLLLLRSSLYYFADQPGSV